MVARKREGCCNFTQERWRSPWLGRLRPPRADRRFAACVQLRGVEPTRRQPRGNFSLARNLAHCDDRTKHRLPHWSEPQRCKVALGDTGQRACRRPVGRRVHGLHLYVAEFNSYNRIYGSLGAVVGFMTWIWLGRDRSHRGGAGHCNRKANVHGVRRRVVPHRPI